jgi:hypothetical protein
MAAIGTLVGLCHCSFCEVYACRYCWGEDPGVCPVCAFRYVAASSVGAATIRWRSDLRAPLAVGALVVLMALLALAVGGLPGTTSGQAGVASASPGESAGPSPADGSTGAPGASASPTVIPATITPIPTDTDLTTPGTEPSLLIPTPNPTSTPFRTPSPTRTPTPTPRPTPTPTPTPVCRRVPDLVGLTVSSARAAWTGAGFTGSFDPAKGHDNMVVVKQSQPDGACLPPAATITVTYARSPAPVGIRDLDQPSIPVGA